MNLNYSHITKEYNEVVEKLSNTTDSDDLKKLGKRQAALLPMVNLIERLEKVKADISDNEKMVAEKSELSEIAAAELPALKEEETKLLEQIRIGLLPKDKYDDHDIIVEIRAGAGGDESTLFAAELFRMYQKYAEGLGYKVSIISTAPAWADTRKLFLKLSVMGLTPNLNTNPAYTASSAFLKLKKQAESIPLLSLWRSCLLLKKLILKLILKT